MARWHRVLAFAAVLALVGGCESIISGLFLPESTEQRHIRQDERRQDRGERMEYHREARDLSTHKLQNEAGFTHYRDP